MDAKTSARTFWSAKAIAIPPTPRPAINALILYPKFEMNNKNPITHNVIFTNVPIKIIIEPSKFEF